MLTIEPGFLPIPKFHAYLLGAVAPRPIAFVSTVDKDGNVNLSPFSFFNVFGSNPPIAIFSPARRGRDNTVKHTFENVLEVKEAVINIVNYPMVNQASLASTEYPRGVNEFLKAGFTMEPSQKVQPPRVKESPVQMECIIREVIETGKEGGAGNLVIAEIVLIHISEDILDNEGRIDQHKIDLVGRLGGDWYVRASGNALFEVEKPLTRLGIGIDQIPETIRFSKELTGNHLGMLGNVEQVPDPETSRIYIAGDDFRQLLEKENIIPGSSVHTVAARLLDAGHVDDAWKWLIAHL